MKNRIFLEVNWSIPEAEGILRKISTWECGDGWSLVCVWSNKSPPLPRSIEIRRETSEGDSFLRGQLTLLRNFEAISDRKIFQLMESGFTVTDIKLNYVNRHSTTFSITPSFLLMGYVDISPCPPVFPSWFYRPFDFSDEKLTKQLNCLEHLSHDLAKLIHPETCIAADVNLKCGSTSFPAHKTILSARSPVFAAMFASPMRESAENQVDITDIGESVLGIMLTFMYTGVVTGKDSSHFLSPVPGPRKPVSKVLELLIAADRYQIWSLKFMCCEFLKKNVSPENVFMLLDVGDAVDGDLKCFAMNYIVQCKDYSTLLSTEAWKSLKHSKPSFAIEILSSVVERKKGFRTHCLKKKARLRIKANYFENVWKISNHK